MGFTSLPIASPAPNARSSERGTGFMKSKAMAAVAALVLSATPTQAQNYSTDGFTIGEFSDLEGCYARGDWTLAGRSQINFEVWLLSDGDVMVKVWSYGWSRPSEDATKTLGVIFWGSGTEKEVFGLVGAPTGTDLSDKPGLAALLPPERRNAFLTAFASSRAFTIVTRAIDATDGVPFDTVLEGGLQGSSLALTRLRTCSSDVRRREDARRVREAGVAHIARDPFKPAD